MGYVNEFPVCIIMELFCSLYVTERERTRARARERENVREREGKIEREIVWWDPNGRDNVIYYGSFIEHYLQSVDRHDRNIFFLVCFNKDHQIRKSGFGSRKNYFWMEIEWSAPLCPNLFSSHAIKINQHCSIHFSKNCALRWTKYYWLFSPHRPRTEHWTLNKRHWKNTSNLKAYKKRNKRIVTVIIIFIFIVINNNNNSSNNYYNNDNTWLLMHPTSKQHTYTHNNKKEHII